MEGLTTQWKARSWAQLLAPILKALVVLFPSVLPTFLCGIVHPPTKPTPL